MNEKLNLYMKMQKGALAHTIDVAQQYIKDLQERIEWLERYRNNPALITEHLDKLNVELKEEKKLLAFKNMAYELKKL